MEEEVENNMYTLRDKRVALDEADITILISNFFKER